MKLFKMIAMSFMQIDQSFITLDLNKKTKF